MGTPMSIIDRLRAAKGPDRELGRDVLLACGWRKVLMGNFYGPLYQWFGPNGVSFMEDELPCPTKSLDIAITLVPVDCMWDVGSNGPDDGPWACVTNAASEDFSEHAATPAIALTIAALLARGIG